MGLYPIQYFDTEGLVRGDFSQGIHCLIVADAVYISGKRPVDLQPDMDFPYFHKNLVYKVFRKGWDFDKINQVGIDGSVVSIVQFGKCALVAVFQQFQQLCIGMGTIKSHSMRDR
jgi:hypothetical protein